MDNEPADIIDTVRASDAVERVSGRVRRRTTGSPAPGADTPAVAPRSADHLRTAGDGLSRWLAADAALAIVVASVTMEWRFGVIVAAATLVIGALVRIDRRVQFTFGEGFIGFRRELGWPVGVQEDDDVHWSWNGATKMG